jgi:O-antigen ligase
VRIHRLFHLLFYLFCFTIPLHQLVSVRLLIAALVVSFFVKPQRPISSLKSSWDTGLYILVLIAGLVYSQDLISGFKVLETSFSLMAIPIVMNRMGNSESAEIERYFKVFCFGLFAACLICLAHAGFQYYESRDIQSFSFYKLTSFLNFHPTYFAYYLIFAITYCLYAVYYGDMKFNGVGGILFASFLFCMLLLTGSKTTFVCLLLVFSFFILKFLVEKRTTHRRNAIVAIVTMLICLFIVNYTEGDIRSRTLNDSWERMILWESTFRAVPDLIFGVGTGDYKIELNNYYRSHQLTAFAAESLNSHNQILQLLFSNGLLGVLAFVLLIARPLYLAVRTQNMLAVLTFFPFVIYGITEVFLGRYQGVVFFAWLHQVFTFWMLSEKPAFLNKLSN